MDFPPSDEDTLSKRPCYLEEKQRQILEARRRNCGVDGKPILFYSRRRDLGQKKAVPQPPKQPKNNQYADIIDGLMALNVNVTVAQVELVVKELFPQGTDGTDPGEVIRAVFLRIRSQNPPDKQGR